MPKGHNCPKCGKNTFHQAAGSAVRTCSSCQAIGWLEDGPASAGPGRGSKCGHCDAATFRTIYESGNLAVRFCSSCQSVAISN